MSPKSWKSITKMLVDDHNSSGTALVPKSPHSTGVPVNLSGESLCLQVEGRELPLKRVRRFLWDNRKHRSVTRDRAVFWSAYLPHEDRSILGVGGYTSHRVAKRMGAV